MKRVERIEITVFFLLLIIISLDPLHAQGKPSIGIFTCKVQGVDPWDPDSILSGIAGSEEAVIYLSRQLSHLGYAVVVFGNPPQDSPHRQRSANPRYVDLDDDDAGHAMFDIAISWRMPGIGADLKKRAKKVYLWPHDTLHHPFTEGEIQMFDGILWLSRWQRRQWASVNPAFAKYAGIFGNGVEKGQFHQLSERINPHSCIYGSNYARGLQVLLDIWPEVKRQFPDATLDIYYGWQHWGLLTSGQEARMKRQIREYAKLGVTDHGKVGHEELNRAYERSSIWAYPCICPETFCITALRAQGAGVLPVIIEGTALAETVRGGFKCAHAADYLEVLSKAMKYAEKISLKEREELRKFVFEEYTWEKIAEKWDAVFRRDLAGGAGAGIGADSAGVGIAPCSL